MHRDEARAAVEVCRASESCDRQGFPGECQNGRCAKRDDELWMHKFQFLVQPPSIVLHLSRRRFLVDATFSALLELEVLDGIGDVDSMAVNARIGHRAIED